PVGRERGTGRGALDRHHRQRDDASQHDAAKGPTHALDRSSARATGSASGCRGGGPKPIAQPSCCPWSLRAWLCPGADNRAMSRRDAVGARLTRRSLIAGLWLLGKAHPFRPVIVMPATNCFCIAKKTTRTGSTMNVAAAISML